MKMKSRHLQLYPSKQSQENNVKPFEQLQLREELSVVYDALNSSVNGVIITNLDGRITFVNPAFLRTFEYVEKTEVLGKNAAELFVESGVRKFSDIKAIIDKTKGEIEEFRVQRSDGTVFPVEVSSSNVTDHKGNVVGRMASFVDVSERKRAVEELEKTNKELDSFVGAVSHDLKQPIRIVYGFADLLYRKYEEKLDDKGREYLNHIKNSALRMDSLVSGLLSLAEIGHVVSIFKNISSASLAKEVVDNLEMIIESQGVEIVVEKDLPYIYCDEKRIYQVFDNLINNAIKFSQNNSHPKVKVGYEDHPGFHQFFVKDNGIGIDPQHHQKIFEMFSRLREQKDANGTGLGLTIVETIVNAHGGKVWVESEKGKGATFFFSLPKRPPAKP
jgi:PAS domain S-box-containing protein